MRFTKMQGAGNDYVYVNAFEEALPEDDLPKLARQISDRHFGVGGDGLILIRPSRIADARMQMFNADGSESEMCGNGIRCVAKYVHDHGLCTKKTLRIETGAGILSLELEVADGLVRRVRVDMGEPVLEPARIPVEFPRPFDENRIIDFPIDEYIPLGEPARWMEDCGFDGRMTCVSMGNPHMIIYCRYVNSVPLELLGPFFERQPVFPNRINVHFVEVNSSAELTMRTWERGTGITLACGTGACAACAAGVLTGRTERNVLIHLPGGDLQLEWSKTDNHVFMTGPAEEVFSGEWNAV
ncbi:MAG: diaminopimelate epimerase [Pirellulales bacterium]|nr:diaminopimelate epimerase [Pirellulales bacterium]